MENVEVEEVVLHWDKFTLVKVPVVGKDNSPKVVQISVSGHNHTKDKINRLVNKVKRGNWDV